MPVNLTYLQNPVQGDRGNSFCPIIEDNFEKIDAHTHDGSTSAPIPAYNQAKGTITLDAASLVWDGAIQMYVATVTLPTGYVFANSSFKVTSGNDVINPSISLVSTVSMSIGVISSISMSILVE